MARRKAGRVQKARRAKPAAAGKRRAAATRSAKRPARTARAKRAAPKRTAPKRAAPKRAVAKAPPRKAPRLDRARRTLDDSIVPTPPSSLDMDRHSSAARSGRAEMADNLFEHRNMS